MTEDQAEEVIEGLELLGYYDVEIRPDYSGRGMYGDTCVALVIERDVPVAAIGYVFGTLGYEWEDIPKRQDSMGLGTVLY